MHFLYVLRSKGYNRTYIGVTSDIKKRVVEHNEGSVNSTKAYRPYDLVHVEEFASKTEALKREINLKRHSQQKSFCFESSDWDNAGVA